MSNSTSTTLSTMSSADVAAHVAASHVRRSPAPAVGSPAARAVENATALVARWEREERLATEAQVEYQLAAGGIR